MSKKIIYSEPADYFPKGLRKKYQIGEFAPKEEAERKPTKKATKKK